MHKVKYSQERFTSLLPLAMMVQGDSASACSLNMLMRLMTQEELERSDNSFFTKIIRLANRTTIRDGRTNDGSNDLSEHNEEPPD